jgi:hypothetical protein
MHHRDRVINMSLSINFIGISHNDEDVSSPRNLQLRAWAGTVSDVLRDAAPVLSGHPGRSAPAFARPPSASLAVFIRQLAAS